MAYIVICTLYIKARTLHVHYSCCIKCDKPAVKGGVGLYHQLQVDIKAVTAVDCLPQMGCHGGQQSHPTISADLYVPHFTKVYDQYEPYQTSPTAVKDMMVSDLTCVQTLTEAGCSTFLPAHIRMIKREKLTNPISNPNPNLNPKLIYRGCFFTLKYSRSRGMCEGKTSSFWRDPCRFQLSLTYDIDIKSYNNRNTVGVDLTLSLIHI